MTDDFIKGLVELPPIEPSISASEIKKRLYQKVKELDLKQGNAIHPGIIGFMVGQYGILKDLYEELYGRAVTDEEIRGWKKDFGDGK